MAKFIHGYNLEVDPVVGSISDDIFVKFSAVKPNIAQESILEENGRTYAGYKKNAYFLPNDAEEQARLDFQHELYLEVTGGQLGIAPVKSPQHCLDAATGTGIWAIQYAQKNPDCQVVGTDLSLIQGGQVTPNCRFVQQDLENEDWIFEHQFDHIHFRYVVACFDDTPAVIKKAYDCLKPGGWIEFYDVLPIVVPLDDNVRGTAVEQWYNLILQGALTAGRDMSRPERYARWCEDTGFVNVTERRFPFPSNGLWPKDATMKKIGKYFMKIQIGLVGSLNKFVRLAGLSVEEAASLEARAKEDLRDPKIHYYVNICMIYAQKSLNA
ncbi:hypothetical protein LMH87_010948 [Akanthomyces muscarius]|uniref:S-adenosyl-L-methionine-dependent methyltransferase n=1 Tax=Akanthomyces muscarius TaxID=2231603 RepID=A0A9W8UKM2_AKAMU|nr:hypothetical protein LMH87_010948 [Akanthomyces muscarius]KAJ4150185.1 hypothetical protein LMH87_010948 [Akanthomyces muscarius]